MSKKTKCIFLFLFLIFFSYLLVIMVVGELILCDGREVGRAKVVYTFKQLCPTPFLIKKFGKKPQIVVHSNKKNLDSFVFIIKYIIYVSPYKLFILLLLLDFFSFSLFFIAYFVVYYWPFLIFWLWIFMGWIALLSSMNSCPW